jgi:hypothetical protein
MLLGDLVRGKDPDIHLGQFYVDREVLIQSLEMLVTFNAKRIYMSHGESIDNETFRKSIEEI